MENSDVSHDESVRLLNDALHALAQPLTALSFTLELGRLQTDAAALRQALESALVECHRAFRAVEQVRDASRMIFGGEE